MAKQEQQAKQTSEPSAAPLISTDELYDDGYLHLEYPRYYVTFGGRPFYNFTRKEFFILARLTRDFGRLVRPEELWQAAWKQEDEINFRTLRVHIMTLRRKLLPFEMDILTTVHMGYRLARHHVAPSPTEAAVNEPHAII